MKDYKSAFNKILKLIYLLAAVIFIASTIYSDIKDDDLYLKCHFKGVVKKIDYNDKSTPTVTINSRTYGLAGSHFNFNRLIEKGDSLEKDSGRTKIKLIKHNGGKVIVFD